MTVIRPSRATQAAPVPVTCARIWCRPAIRPARPMIRACRPTVIIFGTASPSAASQSNASPQ